MDPATAIVALRYEIEKRGLVAQAYERGLLAMASPWKDLLAYYQQREDARIKYEQVIAQFIRSDELSHGRLLALGGVVGDLDFTRRFLGFQADGVLCRDVARRGHACQGSHVDDRASRPAVRTGRQRKTAG